MKKNKKIAVIGAGLGGIFSSILFANEHGAHIDIFENSAKLQTNGAGILLYSNALIDLKRIGLLPQILKNGFKMYGNTDIVDYNNNNLGMLTYKSLDVDIPPYLGINRHLLLKILYDESIKKNVNFIFDSKTLPLDEFENYDLIIAADGVHSSMRSYFWKNLFEKQYSGFCLWHVLHTGTHFFTDKNLVILPNKRFGVIPTSPNSLYFWASIKLEDPPLLNKKEQTNLLKESFNICTGTLKELFTKITDDTYVHFSPVYEVEIKDKWHNKNIVLLGDAAHASLPFMAQGSAMAFHDAILLSEIIDWNNLDESLTEYYNSRKPITDIMREQSRRIGETYGLSSINIEKTQTNLDNFYNQLKKEK